MLTIVFSHQKYFINEHAIMYRVAQILRKFSFCTFRLGLSWNFSSAFLLSRRWMETDRSAASAVDCQQDNVPQTLKPSIWLRWRDRALSFLTHLVRVGRGDDLSFPTSHAQGPSWQSSVLKRTWRMCTVDTCLSSSRWRGPFACWQI